MAESSIKKFYDGAEIFITGGSGFVGRVLIEKLLRSCEGISKIFLLMRSKKGVEAKKRIEKLTDCMLFEILKSKNPQALDKIEIIEGDMMEIQLGISPQNLAKLKNCSHIFNVAASVRFDDPIKDALLMNTRGTREVCRMASEMPNLKSLVHVSTTFIQPKKFFADEIFYPADFDWKKFIKMAENFDHETMNFLEKKLTKFAPNTYTFTKHLAEQVCKDFRDEMKLPIIIVRPSIISSSEFEPFSGHLDNVNGPFAFTMGSEIGIYQVTLVSRERRLDYIPVDILIKGMIIAGWKDWKEKCEKIPIYNAAGIKKPCFEVMSLAPAHKMLPPINAFMYSGIKFVKCSAYAWIIRIVEMIIPALIIDRLLVFNGEKPKLMKIQRKIYEADQATAIFSSRDYDFVNANFRDLGSNIPVEEKEEFFIDEKLNQFLHKLMTATYLMMLKEFFGQKIPQDNEKAKKRYKKVVFISRSYQIIAYSLLIYFTYKIINEILLNYF